MIDREGAIAAALKLAVDDPQERPVAGVGNVFTRDAGRSWTVHLVPEPLDARDGCIVVETPGVYIAVVSGLTGNANWVETL